METSLNKEWMMMRKFLLGTVSAVALGGTAMAADLPSRQYAPPPPVIPIFTWTGFYVGVNAGYGWSTHNNDVFVPGIGTVSGNSNSGFVGGGQVGYNYQFGAFVAGLEADIQYADLNRNGNSNVFGFNNTALGGGNNGGMDYFGTVRARLGWAIDHALIYATGGFAYGGGGNNNNTVFINGIAVSNGNNSTNTGWTVGGGVEYAFTNNFTARVEGLYVNLGSNNNNNAALLVNNTLVGATKSNNEFGVVRAGLNYKFSSF
jgi:outer membrane immunogenic protein